MESLILNLIKQYPNEYENILKDKKIKINNEKNFQIYNYDIEADFSDPVVQEARGIIIDTKNKRVVCWPFRKFGNWQEDYADNIDWKSARVEEKIDGSIMKLWFYNEWHWSTNSCINADNASIKDGNSSFLALIHKAENFGQILFEELDKNYTYIFELVSPYNQIVIRYPKTSLWHIGTRDNRTGEEMKIDIGIKQPKNYPLNSLDDCINAVKMLNANNDNKVKQEGFVVVDKNWHRVKIKSPEYVAIHKYVNNGMINKNNAIKLLLESPEFAEKLAISSNTINTQMKYYTYKIAEFKMYLEYYLDYVRNLYEEYSHSRKAVANEIKNDKLSAFGFKAIGNNMSVDEILKTDKNQKILISSIEEYKRDYERIFEKR